MVITNEPGYYKEGSYGIRLENMITVIKSDKEKFLKFKCLTLIPYCSLLIKEDMLEKRHLNSITDYYKRINQELSPILSNFDYNLGYDYL